MNHLLFCLKIPILCRDSPKLLGGKNSFKQQNTVKDSLLLLHSHHIHSLHLRIKLSQRVTDKEEEEGEVLFAYLQFALKPDPKKPEYFKCTQETSLDMRSFV